MVSANSLNCLADCHVYRSFTHLFCFFTYRSKQFIKVFQPDGVFPFVLSKIYWSEMQFSISNGHLKKGIVISSSLQNSMGIVICPLCDGRTSLVIYFFSLSQSLSYVDYSMGMKLNVLE